MMSSAAWGGQDRPMTSTAGADFHQFLDMNEITSLDDAMQFDFHAFQDDNSHHMLSPHQRQAADTLMGNTDHQPGVLSGPDAHAHAHAQAQALLSTHPAASMASAARAAHAPVVPASMMNHRSASDDAISLIDAQIQYLQQQKYQQRQQQMREQQAFFSPSGGGGPRQQPMAPTPHSIEMTPGSGHFYSTPDHMSSSSRGAFERGYHQRLAEQQDMAFTPLVSPAVTPLTPLDAHFSIDNAFVVPAAYFSPLTSPALRAQNDASSVYDYGSGHSHNSPSDPKDSAACTAAMVAAPVTAPTTTTATPTTTTTTTTTTTAPSSSFQSTPNLDAVKRHSRKNTATKIRAKPSVKNSPICKPQRRKTGPSPAMVSQVLSEVDESRLRALDPESLALPASSSETSDECASVSPDASMDMPPPPVPARRSTSVSPYIQPQGGNPLRAAGAGAGVDESQLHPATPASLMKLPASKASSTSTTTTTRPVANISRPENAAAPATDIMESLELPEAISNRGHPPVPPIITQLPSASPHLRPSSSQSHQVLDAPLASSSSSSAPPPSARGLGISPTNPSPRLQPGSKSVVFSPSSASSTSASIPASPAPGAVRKPSHLAPRHSRKRSSGSVLISPALLPKLSPNIKPLLSGTAGMSAEDQASRLLITKSNYQNILEGNQVPGVSYPSELSTNITSKRTSHKIAEQGRRNRINSALQIMAGLLPESKLTKDVTAAAAAASSSARAVLSGDDSGDKKDGAKQANASNSKASVVENAIVHMQKLEKENGDLREELKALKEQLEKLQGRGEVA